jgi:glycosyltransferase involved in cell wall biosynthesis
VPGLRIAIDGSVLTGRFTGDRTYWSCLTAALGELGADDTYLLYTPERPSVSLPGVDVRLLPGRNRRWWSLVRLPLAVRRDGAHLLHVQYTVSPLASLPAVTTVHDVSFLIEPSWFRPKDRLLLRLSVPASMRRAKRVITVSEASRRDILALTGLPPEKVAVTPLAPPPGFSPVSGAAHIVEQRLGLKQPYVLVVGTMQPRKNQGLAIRAFAEARQAASFPHVLAVAGKEGWGRQEAECDAVQLLGYVPDDLLPALYSAADALLFPSLYEGFGLPVLEAMACGCPVVCSDRGALPEVAGDAALVLPPEPGRWRDALMEMLAAPDRREELRRRGLDRAKMFTWRETARRTSEVYGEVAK